MLFLKFAHVVLMFAGVAFTTGAGMVPTLMARSDDVRGIRSVFGLWARMSRGVPMLFIVGGLFGLATALAIGYNLLRPWLVIAYVLFAVLAMVGARIESPWFDRVLAAALASPDDAPSSELRALLADRRRTTVFWASNAIVIVLIFDMVVKPLS